MGFDACAVCAMQEKRTIGVKNGTVLLGWKSVGIKDVGRLI